MNTQSMQASKTSRPELIRLFDDITTLRYTSLSAGFKDHRTTWQAPSYTHRHQHHKSLRLLCFARHHISLKSYTYLNPSNSNVDAANAIIYSVTYLLQPSLIFLWIDGISYRLTFIEKRQNTQLSQLEGELCLPCLLQAADLYSILWDVCSSKVIMDAVSLLCLYSLPFFHIQATAYKTTAASQLLLRDGSSSLRI